MIRWLMLVVACVKVGPLAQPIACSDDSQCSSGYYCVSEVHFCHKCLRCEDLKREPPRATVSCIRSVTDCGPCLKGLVVDTLGSVDASCTEPATGVKEEASSALPAYVWVVIVVCLLIFALVLAAIVYMLRHTDTFKILASTRATVQAPVVNNVTPTAPQPPPYNYSAEYAPVRPSSPPAPPVFSANNGTTIEDPTLPLVKRAPSSRGRDARESAGNQNARVFNNPSYVRNSQPPPSYESAVSDDSDHEAPFIPHDEDTIESPWTPGNSASNSNNNNCGGENTVAVTSTNESENAHGSTTQALRRPSRSEAMSPPRKLKRVTEDTNNNRSRGSGDSGEPSGALPHPAPPAPPAAAANLVINVLNVNSVRQLNDISL